MSNYATDDNCIFCKIIAGKIPSFKLVDNDKVFSFLDIGPLSKGHALVIPKRAHFLSAFKHVVKVKRTDHGVKLHDIPDEYLSAILPACKKIAQAEGLVDYNILENNGRVAHQVVDHVHFHVIPKPSDSDQEGLVIGWPTKPADMDELKKYHEEIKARL